MDNWRKSSFSSANGGSCIETASDNGAVLVRDTTDRDGPVLTVSPDAWGKFTATLRWSGKSTYR
jgi:Domain of unknown function (DUF397)